MYLGCQLRFTSLCHFLTYCSLDVELRTVYNFGLQMLDVGLVWYLRNHSRIHGACILLTTQVLHPFVILMPYTQGVLFPSASVVPAIRRGLGRYGSGRWHSWTCVPFISRNKHRQPFPVQCFLEFLLELHGYCLGARLGHRTQPLLPENISQ